MLQGPDLQDLARSSITVVAYSPHAESAADLAKRMIADIDAGKGRAAWEELAAGARESAGSR
jgi:hypothetical protein